MKKLATKDWDKIKKFRGQWVAMWKKKVVAHGKDGKMVYKQALQKCKEPMIFQVPEDEEEVYLL